MTSKHVMIGPMTCPTCNAALPEYDELRAEVERLKRLYDDVYAENQRLNQALDMLAEEREAWESDNERLRAALTEIMAMSEPAGYSERSKAEIRDVARRALERAKEC